MHLILALGNVSLYVSVLVVCASPRHAVCPRPFLRRSAATWHATIPYPLLHVDSVCSLHVLDPCLWVCLKFTRFNERPQYPFSKILVLLHLAQRIFNAKTVRVVGFALKCSEANVCLAGCATWLPHKLVWSLVLLVLSRKLGLPSSSFSFQFPRFSSTCFIQAFCNRYHSLCFRFMAEACINCCPVLGCPFAHTICSPSYPYMGGQDARCNHSE